ncbi:helix-turn-helix domain-containing protein [Streptomyces sp. NPDC026672]|uniref:helix-turn-helix domain-containing protein n=1 Tax=unclassified Streptomyces TaxID=2593676 RepID=UPI0033F915D3
MTMRLRRLLASDVLGEHTVLAGASGLSNVVHAVVTGAGARSVRDAAPGSLVVFAGDGLRLEEPDADLAVRFAAGARVAGLVARRPRSAGIALSTRRLADRHAVPLIVVDRPDPAAAVAALESEVRAPEITRGRLISSVVREVGARSGAADIVRTLGKVLRTPVALLDGEARPVEGDTGVDWQGLLAAARVRLGTDHPGSRSLGGSDDQEVLLHPVVLPPGRRADLWFAAVVDPDGPTTPESARDCLAIAGLAFTSHLAGRSLAWAQEGRDRTLLLTEILETAPVPARDTVERAAMLGWRLSGWHTAVHLAFTARASEGRPMGAVGLLEAALGRAGLDVSLVDRPEGWMFWVTDDAPPDAAAIGRLTRAVRAALLDAGSRGRTGMLCAGVGLPHSGAAGIGASLEESRRACMIARARAVGGAVEVTDPGGLRRLLDAWYAYAPTQELADEVLAPLRQIDPTGELGRTLACYLDHESSLATTAAALGVHRNTVLNRLARIRSALGVDLADPNDRLAAHLATRAGRMDTPEAE